MRAFALLSPPQLKLLKPRLRLQKKRWDKTAEPRLDGMLKPPMLLLAPAAAAAEAVDEATTDLAKLHLEPSGTKQPCWASLDNYNIDLFEELCQLMVLQTSSW